MSELHVQKAYEIGVLTESNRYEDAEGWRILNSKISNLEKKIDSRTFGVTSQFSHDKAFGVMTPKSKVEQFCLREIEDKEELRVLEEIKVCCQSSFKCCKLSTLERELLKQLVNRETTPSRFAKEHGIYPSYVYKIRNRGHKKIQDEIEKALFAI